MRRVKKGAAPAAPRRRGARHDIIATPRKQAVESTGDDDYTVRLPAIDQHGDAYEHFVWLATTFGGEK